MATMTLNKAMAEVIRYEAESERDRLIEERTAARLGDVAGDALRSHRESAGDALATVAQVRAGRIVEFRTAEEAPHEIIDRERKRADEAAQGAALAQSVVWAVQGAQAEKKAAEGNPRAKESVAVQKRWDQENREIADATA